MGDLRCVAWPRTLFRVLFAGLCFASLLIHDASAERRQWVKPGSLGGIGARINSNTVSFVSGDISGTYLSTAYDLSAVLDDGDDLQILPIVGKGGSQTIRDVRFLRGVDLGITRSKLVWLEYDRQTLAEQPAVRQRFDEFLARGDRRVSAAISPEQREKLFQEFLQWNGARQDN